MTFKEKEAAERMKQSICIQQGGKCATCGKPLVIPFDLSHKIPKGKVNLKKYGPEVIHHRLNVACTCPGSCNDAVMINPATQPVKAAEHVRRIKEALIEENR